jgi:hypothetical protein
MKNIKLTRQGVRDLNDPPTNARGPQPKLWGKHYCETTVGIDEFGRTYLYCRGCGCEMP